MSDSDVIAVAWLHQHLHDPSIVVVDVRPPPYFMQGHLPGAVSLPMFFLVGQDGAPPASNQLAARLGALGIRRETHVVAYDDGASPSAGRLYWVLTYYGHPEVSVLDGGITAWLHEGYDSQTVVEPRAPVPYEIREANAAVLATTDELLASLDDPNQIVVDVRSPSEYLGHRVTADRNGHIPGAINIDWTANLEQDEDGIARLRPCTDLRALYESASVLPGKRVVVHCGAGVRAAETFLVLRHLGYENVVHYAAGWQGWGNASETPVEDG